MGLRTSFRAWSDGFDSLAIAQVTVALAWTERVSSQREGAGVLAYRIDFGRGRGVYLGRGRSRATDSVATSGRCQATVSVTTLPRQRLESDRLD
jgi:hypothetical protein